ncbi:MAG: Ig-like domain repeat protein [Actinomycetota bacterium]|nr:MAG: Ig-like domain repeat protein [Actinomycetota bacterium]
MHLVTARRYPRLLAAGGLAVAVAGATVVAAPAALAAPTPVTGAVLEWTGNAELQSAPPHGGCNYFSAGTSDGTLASYATAAGNVSVVKGGGTPSFATKCDGAAAGAMGQKVVVGGGAGSVDPVTGVSTIQWTGTWSVNFYGGLLPFSITDPRLVVQPDGTGQLIATLGGYASSMDKPDVKTPLPAVAGVVVADLTGVAGANSYGFTTTPRYAGVGYDAPGGGTPQNRTAAGWGSWPRSFVDFQLQTGLSSYWYSSGGGADTKKAPSALSVRYGVSTQPPSTVGLSFKNVGKGKQAKVRYGTTVKLKVVVALPGSLAAATGKVVVKDGRKVIRKAKLKKGAASIVLPRLAPGKHKITVVFKGNGTVSKSTASKVLTVVRSR